MLSAGLDAVASLAYLNAANQAVLREHGACKGECITNWEIADECASQIVQCPSFGLKRPHHALTGEFVS